MITIAAILFHLLLLLLHVKNNQIDCFSIKSTSQSKSKSKQLSFNLYKSKSKSTILNRRDTLFKIPSLLTIITTTATATTAAIYKPSPALAISQSSTSTSTSPTNTSANNDIQTIIEAAETLNKLLTNWDKATIDCTYADVPRELLEQKNKEQLLEKASTFALFDKSTSVVSCKKTNKIVRDYIGVTGKGPLVNVDKKMLKPIVVDRIVNNNNNNNNVDIVDLDEYYTQVENFQNAISRASSLSYAAGIADFDSVNNFDKGSQGSPGQENSKFEQARKAIGEAKISIDKIVSFLTLDT